MTNRAFLALLLSWSLALGMAAETAVVSDGTATAPAPAPVVDAAQQLLAQLPQVPGVVARDGKVVWQSGAASATIVGVDEASGNPLVETAIGQLAVNRRLVAEDRGEAVVALAKLVAQAVAEKLEAKGFTLTEGILTGIHLRSDEVIVLPEGVLRQTPVEPSERAPERERLAQAAAALAAALPTTQLNEMGRQTVEDVLKHLDQDDGKQSFDEVAPSFARRVTRHGWARAWFQDQQAVAQAKALEQAVAEAERQRPVRRFAGQGLALAEVKDAFGHGGWVLTTPTRCAFARSERQPEYHSRTPDFQVVVELPPGADPATDAAKATAARIYGGVQALATWSADQGFACDRAVWRRYVPAGGYDDAVTEVIPPHILVANLNGDLAALIVERGVLRPAQDATAAEADRFMADAARLLSDAAQLDLIGQYLLSYVYPSPDSRFPHLIGNKQIKGDVQQTAYQTLANTTGGMCRGDCADIAELYQMITERQGRNPIVIGLPRHAACCWAEKRDEVWHTYLLQTGPALEFSDALLPAALEKTYKNFDQSMPFDANGLPLLLRFSGEQSRSAWRLSYRIFSEPDYCKTMVEVQKDWHFQTYQRGIKTMLGLIAKGDDDNANYRELSGLYSFTGQYDLAAEYHQKAIDRTTDPAGKMYMNVELIGHLLNARREADARKVALEVLDQQIPALKAKLGSALIQVGTQLGHELIGSPEGIQLKDLALRAAKDTMLADMSEQIDQVAAWLVSPKFDQRIWDNHPQLTQIRRLQEEFIGLAVAILKEVGHERLPGDADLRALARAVQQWLNGVAFHDVEERSEVMYRYATAGSYYEAVFGTELFDRLLDQAPIPTQLEAEPAQRLGGAAQLALDLPWIRIAPAYWSMRLRELFSRDHEKLDPQEVARLGGRLAEATAACAKLGLVDPHFESEAHVGAVIVALVGKDAPALHRLLRQVAEKNDKPLRDDTAQWLGDPARFIDLEWYQQVIGIWKQELNYKPKYYWIAWRAALNHAPRHALLVAKVAAAEFKDDPAFTEEYEFMKQVLQPQLDAEDKAKSEAKAKAEAAKSDPAAKPDPKAKPQKGKAPKAAPAPVK